MARQEPLQRKLVYFLLPVVFLITVLGLLYFIVNVQGQLLQKAALESADLYSGALEEFRTIYTKNVVSRVKTHSDFVVSHDYKSHKHSIPLPATMSMELGRRIGQSRAGAESYLYSAFPFPWRKESGGLNDSFREEAWAVLTARPDAPYFQFTDYKGKPVLRYAKADVMRTECVQCHNTHPDTPKAGWAVGDVRGVLEIIHPLEAFYAQQKEGIFNLYTIVFAVVLFGSISIYLVIANHQAARRRLEYLLSEKTREIEAANETLVKNRKMAAVGEMSAQMAHEINQPLGAAILKTQQLKRSINHSQLEKATSTVEKIFAHLQRIDKIISQLSVSGLAVSSEHYELQNVNDVVVTTIAVFRDNYKLEDRELRLNLSDALPSIKANAIELERVILNLLINAFQAVQQQQHKLISIRTQHGNGVVYIIVTDNGCGISDEIKEKVFDPFFTTKRVGEGTGLGLAMCYGIVHALGGDIYVHSKLNEGSTFTIELPVGGAK